MAANIVVETTSNRPYWFDGSGSYGTVNLSELEAHIMSPSEFLTIRVADTVIMCFPKASISQIQFNGSKSEIDSVYSALLGS